MVAPCSRLEKESAFKIGYILDPMMLYLVSIIRTQEVEPKAILIFFHLVEKATPQNCPLRRIDNALEHGVLNPLSEIEACFRDSPESPSSCWIDRADVIADKHKHIDLLDEEWRIDVEISTEMPRKKPCLEMREHPYCHLLFQKRMP